MINYKRGAGIFFFILMISVINCGESDEEEVPQMPVGKNLLKNPSFEKWKGSIPVGWELKYFSGEGENDCLYGKSRKKSVQGKYSFYLRGIYNTDRWYSLVQRSPVMPGYRLRISAQLKAEKLKRKEDYETVADIFVRFLDKNGEPLPSDRYAHIIKRCQRGDVHWHLKEEEREVPEKAYYAEFGLVISMSGYLYCDDVRMELLKPFPWIKKETEYVDFYYFNEHPFPQGAMEKEAARVEDYIERMDVVLNRKIKYYYYGTEDKFKEVTGLGRYEQRSLWEKKELHTIDPEENDEIIHIILSHLGHPPLGLARGLNYALKGSLEGKNIHITARELLKQREIPALYKTLDQDLLIKKGTGRTIPGWVSFCKYLIDRYGMEKLMKLYKETDGIYRPGAFNVRFKDIYGDDFPVIDRAWRFYLLSTGLPEQEGDSIR
jgi:hypothetical protein